MFATPEEYRIDLSWDPFFMRVYPWGARSVQTLD